MKRAAAYLAAAACLTGLLSGCGGGAAVSGENDDPLSGLTPAGSMELSFAEQFTVDTFEGGLSLITIGGEDRYLVVPEGQQAPQTGADITVLQQPLDSIYLVATSAMDFFVSLDALDTISLSGTRADGWYLDAAREAMTDGDIEYAGKYSAPDYEQILAANCGLAIENTMINHTPDVKEKLQKLGLVVLTEQSSSEPKALGRVEWIKLFGVLFDKEDEATHLFNEQKARVEQTSGLASSGKTVAYFYINSNGAAVTRRAGDYVAQMIELAGGSYALDDAQTASTSGSSVTLEMERFYATAKDADIIVYNGTIDESVATLNDFVGKNALLSQFKAVKNGNVWVTSADMYQQMTSTADIIDELHGAFTGDDTSDFHYLRKLG